MLTTPVTPDVEAALEPWSRPGSPGVALAVLRDGEVVTRECRGLADLEHGIPITEDTVFDVASVSKQFAGLAIATLEHEGRLRLDEDIRLHLPDPPDWGHTVTVRHLVHHTSGIRDWVDPLAMTGLGLSDRIEMEHILQFACRQRQLNFAPGDAYSYSNTGYNLLARIVERVTGAPFGRWMGERFFGPMGMMNTRFRDDPRQVVPGLASGYDTNGRGGYGRAPSRLSAPGSSSLLTTLHDMARWLLHCDRSRVVTRAVIERMHQRGTLNNGEVIDYAFGLHIDELAGQRVALHSGWWAGFRAHVVRFLDRPLAAVVLANVQSLDPVDLANRLLEREVPGWYAAAAPLNKPPYAPRPDTPDQPLDHETLSALAGQCHSPELDTTWQVVLDGRSLVIRHVRNPVMKLACRGEYFDGDAWYQPKLRFEFKAGGSGAAALIVSTERIRGIRFERV